MTDKEIIEGLLARDNDITRQFLFVKSRPLFTAILNSVFKDDVEYDELINEFYGYLMDNDGEKLRQFGFRSSIYQWMKIVATRYFIHKREQMIGKVPKETAVYGRKETERIEPELDVNISLDIEILLKLMGNRRYAEVIRNLILYDVDPRLYAKKIGVTMDNLYNIKKRALKSLAGVAIKYYGYGK